MGGMGGGGKGGGGVSSPDFNAIAQQQADISRQNVDQQTAANRANQTNAFGATSQWTKDPTTGQWTQQSSFGGGLGQAVNNLTGQIGSQGALPTGQEARDQAINSAYSQAMSRLKPEWNQREQATQSALANQGLDPSSEAAQAETGNFNRARNDAETSAMASAIGQGTEAWNAIFNQGVTSQMMPYQQLSSLQGLGQQANYNMAGQAQTPDMMGAAQNQYQAALNSNAQKQGGKNSTLGGLGSLAGMAGGMMLGGPVGAGIGSQLGGALGSSLG
jgi:hypothetical protein